MARLILKIGEVHVMSIEIRSSIEGFRRAGVAHSKAAQTYPDGFFSEEQIKQLQAEPRLFVTITLDEADDSSDPSSPETSGPVVEEQRLAELVAHIGQLDKDNESLWMESGAPKTAAMPSGTSAAERDAAWDAFVAQLDAEG